MDVIAPGVEIHHADCYELLASWPDEAALVTDPPYGIGYEHSGGGLGLHGCRRRNSERPVHGDDAPFDPSPFVRFRWVLLWGADHYRARLPAGGTLLAWDKSPHGAGPADSFADCEFAWTNARVKRNVCRYLWKGVACVKAGEDNGRRYYPTQKPQGVCSWCLDVLRLPPGALVIDPFMGGAALAWRACGAACAISAWRLTAATMRPRASGCCAPPSSPASGWFSPRNPKTGMIVRGRSCKGLRCWRALADDAGQRELP